MYRIGVLTESSEKQMEPWCAPLEKRGYVEGKTTYTIRAAGGDCERLPRLAQELVNEKVDVILAISTPPLVAAKRATATIPIVTMSEDPVGAAPNGVGALAVRFPSRSACRRHLSLVVKGALCGA
jgi:putative ABC transport system substrate-binding protein